ncbi:dTDP-4-dehydrorhamnose reductase [Halocynthiibacter styelae]|uniref:dTDP-4-dehydrorhamnose reductase n=1 Tax=Halocynthiibacter styelae TaxID=2761955 RepID=A0A8J7LQF9_9RHOB|nr:dTDP-4-dehydrorhamnose reductase [Paenihalocynthiibacter styelae]MBI1495071.1 dTDP-4-dehydrorhamnose reductase [Paenihalocynthiibacter styelae]
MRIAIFGKTGQVATELQRIGSGQHDIQVLGRDVVDFSNPKAVTNAAAQLDVHAVINAVAYTAVDRAEEETELANTINGASVDALATACAASNTPLVHISTDYVFDGSGEKPWKTTDHTAPVNAYGQSKLMGEQAITASKVKAAILRTSWIFSAHGNNFVKTMLRLGAERDVLTIVGDQIGGPTSAHSIARACLTLAEKLHTGGPPGLYHLSGYPNVSWADFAREIFARSDLSPQIRDIPGAEFPTPAKRPQNSRLDCSLIFEDHKIERPSWRDDLRHILEDLKKSKSHQNVQGSN